MLPATNLGTATTRCFPRWALGSLEIQNGAVGAPVGVGGRAKRAQGVTHEPSTAAGPAQGAAGPEPKAGPRSPSWLALKANTGHLQERGGEEGTDK